MLFFWKLCWLFCKCFWADFVDTCGIPKQAKTFQSLRTPTCLQNSIPNFYQHLKNAKVLPHVLFKPPHPPKRFAFAGGKPTIWGSFFTSSQSERGTPNFIKHNIGDFMALELAFPWCFPHFWIFLTQAADIARWPHAAHAPNQLHLARRVRPPVAGLPAPHSAAWDSHRANAGHRPGRPNRHPPPPRPPSMYGEKLRLIYAEN